MALFREQHPKQLIGLLNDAPLLASTVRRLDGLTHSDALLCDVIPEHRRMESADKGA